MIFLTSLWEEFFARKMKVILLPSFSRDMLEKKLSSDSENLVMKVSRSCRIWKKIAPCTQSKYEFSYWHWQNHSYLKRSGIPLFLISSLEMITLLLESLSQSFPQQWRMRLCKAKMGICVKWHIVPRIFFLNFHIWWGRNFASVLLYSLSNSSLFFEVHLVLPPSPVLLSFGTDRSPKRFLGFSRLIINVSC